jgi:hypothetical protein
MVTLQACDWKAGVSCQWPSWFALYKPLSGRDARKSTMAVLLMNNNYTPAQLSFVWADLLSRMRNQDATATATAISTCILYDVHARKILGAVSTQGSYETTAPVASRDSVFLTLSDCH